MGSVAVRVTELWIMSRRSLSSLLVSVPSLYSATWGTLGLPCLRVQVGATGDNP